MISLSRRRRTLRAVYREIIRPNIQRKFECDLCDVVTPRSMLTESNRNPKSEQAGVDSLRGVEGDRFVVPLATGSDAPDDSTESDDVLTVQKLLKLHGNGSVEELERALHQWLCGVNLNEDLVLQVLRRHRSDWKPAFLFFNWVSKGEGARSFYVPGPGACNEILDILGRMKRFGELGQVLEEMSKREGAVSEGTFAVLLNRYSAAHKVGEAIEIFYKRREFGLELDLAAFQTLLMSLCRYKHVEAAEFLFNSKQNEFPPDIKTRNIILNGWCVLGSLRDVKRFWNEIICSKCKPDLYTYGIFINSLTKAGKISTAVKLFHAMWEKGCTPDVTICNSIIDGLCFKKRIGEALDIFGEMNEKGCLPDVATYNTLIKQLCKIRRMEKAYELVNEMEHKRGSCTPNSRTYCYLLKSLKEPKEVPELLERIERNGCKIMSDMYNLILRLYMDWNVPDKVQSTLDAMERKGLGPDQRSYTIMIHGLYSKGRMEEALQFFAEMRSKGMIPEPRTRLLVKAMNIKLKEKECEQGREEGMNEDSSPNIYKQKKRAK